MVIDQVIHVIYFFPGKSNSVKHAFCGDLTSLPTRYSQHRLHTAINKNDSFTIHTEKQFILFHKSIFTFEITMGWQINWEKAKFSTDFMAIFPWGGGGLRWVSFCFIITMKINTTLEGKYLSTCCQVTLKIALYFALVVYKYC